MLIYVRPVRFSFQLLITCLQNTSKEHPDTLKKKKISPGLLPTPHSMRQRGGSGPGGRELGTEGLGVAGEPWDPRPAAGKNSGARCPSARPDRRTASFEHTSLSLGALSSAGSRFRTFEGRRPRRARRLYGEGGATKPWRADLPEVKAPSPKPDSEDIHINSLGETAFCEKTNQSRV